jgi:DNA-directed RNA polymerase specialized sigma24 family protein
VLRLLLGTAVTAPTRLYRERGAIPDHYVPPPTRWADTYPGARPALDDETPDVDDSAPDVDWVRIQRALNGDPVEAALMNPDEFAEAVWSAILRRGLSPSATAELLHCNGRAVRTVISPPPATT